MHSTSLGSLMLVMILSFFIPILLQRLRLHFIPVVVAEIIAGIIIGKSGFNLIEVDNWLQIISSLGFIFLMFLSGLEIDFGLLFQKRKKTIKSKKEPSPPLVSLAIFIGILIFSFAVSLLFKQVGLTKNAFFLTLIVSTVSLGIVVPALRDANVSKTKMGQTILLTAVIGDLTTMILLTVFASLYSKGNQNTWLILVLFAAGVVLYFFLKFLKNVPYLEKLAKGNVHIDTRAIFTLIIALVGLSETVGAENILGAFLAGALVSLLSPDPEMVRKLDAFGYGFFIPIFFVMVGIKMDLKHVFTDLKVLMFIPLLLLAMYGVKILPALILKKWYPWKKVISSGILLSSKLTLVIAATSIGTKMKILSATQSSSLILVGVITSILSPILFKSMNPRKTEEQQSVSIIGSNPITIPVSMDLVNKNYKVFIYGDQATLDKQQGLRGRPGLSIIELEDYTVENLEEKEAFEKEILVIATNDEKQNVEIASYAKNIGLEHVIVRTENPLLHDQLVKNEGYGVFSTLYSSRVLLKSMIMNPSLMRLIAEQEGHIKEFKLKNRQYDGVPLRSLPILGNVLILQIIRNNEVIIPHGDTKLMVGDKVLINGDESQLNTFEKEFK